MRESEGKRKGEGKRERKGIREGEGKRGGGSGEGEGVTYVGVVALGALYLVLNAHDAFIVDAHVRLLRHAQSLW